MEVVTEGFLTYRLEDDDEYSIISCDAEADVVEIPLSVNEKPVTQIEESAFADCQKLRSVIFPDDIELQVRCADSFEIGDYAFNGCTALIKIEIPYGVSFIGRGAFRDCTALKRVELPEYNLPFVSSYAFCNCTSLETITPINNIEEGVFENCESLKDFPVNTYANYIDEDAFRGCYSLESITIPKGVKWIEPLAFRSCRGLKRVIFENPKGWQCSSRYTGEVFKLNLSDPRKNAAILSGVDFDDGVGTWRRS